MDGAPRAAQALGLLGSAALRLLGATWRIRFVERQHEQRILERGGGLLYSFWHAQILPLAYAMHGRDVVVLVSEHRDGEQIRQVIRRIGFRTVRGSTTRGGFRSLVELARLGRGGAATAITPDGPRGPRRKAQPGAVLVAQRGGIPIIPFAGSIRPCKELSSWDRFLIPAPFARVVVGFGPPLTIPPDLGPEAAVAEWTPKLEEAMKALNERTDRELMEWTKASNAADSGPTN